MKNNWEYDEQATRLGDPMIMDLYHLLQALTIFKQGDHERFTVHDYFIRKTPFGSYLMVAGTERVLKNLYNMRFTEEDILQAEIILKGMKNAVPDDFLEYLRKFRFDGNVWAMREGDPAFPNEPIIRLEGKWLPTWIVESAILKVMNDTSLVATYASHVVNAAGGMTLADFMLRRAPGDGAAVSLSRAAYIAGFNSTSNVRAAINLGIPLSGTMSHEFIQAYAAITGSEVNAFVLYGRNNPSNRIYLVDTFDPINGIKNAMKAAEIIGEPAKAIRIDSGNLIGLAKMAREMDSSLTKFTGIFLTSDLNMQSVDDIRTSGAPATGAGVGTQMAKPSNPSSLGGVYKLVAIEIDGALVPTIKISGDKIKILLPGRKSVWRRNKYGVFGGDVISLADEDQPGDGFEQILVPMMEDGKMLVEPRELSEIREFALKNVRGLPIGVELFRNPAAYPVIVSDKLASLKEELIKNAKKI